MVDNKKCQKIDIDAPGDRPPNLFKVWDRISKNVCYRGLEKEFWVAQSSRNS